MRRFSGIVIVGLLSLVAAVGCGSTGAIEPVEAPESAEGLRFGTLTERSIGRDSDGRNTTAAVEGMNHFAVDLYRSAVGQAGANTVVAPYSVTFALSMIYAGARGDTATEIADVLHADGMDAAAWHDGINAYDLTLDARTAGSSTEWNSANKVWVRPGLSLRDEFLDVLTGDYGSPLAETDFAADPKRARRTVNDWVDQQTNSLVSELFPPGSFTPTTVMALVNAVAMDAPWEFPFDPAATVEASFTLADGTTIETPTMHYDEYLPSRTEEAYQAVELPYGGGALSMTVIVPDDLERFEAEMSADSLLGIIGGTREGGIHLSLPKWTARTHLRLDDLLSELGMPTAFTPRADFSGMVQGGGIWVDRVEHEALVEVDESGTRAAAASGGVMAGSHGPTIAVDRPFLYLIHDRGARTILFIGRVLDPSDPS